LNAALAWARQINYSQLPGKGAMKGSLNQKTERRFHGYLASELGRGVIRGVLGARLICLKYSAPDDLIRRGWVLLVPYPVVSVRRAFSPGFLMELRVAESLCPKRMVLLAHAVKLLIQKLLEGSFFVAKEWAVAEMFCSVFFNP